MCISVFVLLNYLISLCKKWVHISLTASIEEAFMILHVFGSYNNISCDFNIEFDYICQHLVRRQLI